MIAPASSVSIARRKLTWIVTGTTRRRGEASIITGASAAGERGQKLGVAGIGETRRVERLLVDRIGDDGSGAARADQPDSGFDRTDHRARIRRIDAPRHARRGQRPVKDRQGVREHARGLTRIVDHLNLDRQIEGTGDRAQSPGIVDRKEDRHGVRPPQPGAQGDLAADAGGLSHRQRKRRKTVVHDRTSMTALRRSSRSKRRPASPNRRCSMRWRTASRETPASCSSPR